MRSAALTFLAVVALVCGSAQVPSAHARVSADGDTVSVYSGELTSAQLSQLRGAGIDQTDVVKVRRGRTTHVELVMGTEQARLLASRGVSLTARRTPAAQRTAGDHVFRPYSGADGVRAQVLADAAAHPALAQPVDIGTSLRGRPITAVRVTAGVHTVRQGDRPVVVYQGAQHAREWISVETVRRFLHHVLDAYGNDPQITKILDTTELWFVPVVNVDGYDYTFTPGNRLWRKNLRDNDGDGKITSADGVDLNRNFPYRWRYDDEGSSSTPSAEDYRGSAAASEPETRAQLALYARIRPVFLLNYHAASQLLLYGLGWQVATPSPDDVIYPALVGDSEHTAVKDYLPELSADLYTTNGETDDEVASRFGTLALTVEQSTCETASARDKSGQWDPDDCPSPFDFPDSERLIQGEFENNLRLMVDVAASAHHPDRPVSPVGRTVPDVTARPFAKAYGGTQTVSAVMRRTLRGKRLNYRIDGHPTRAVPVSEWTGGRRYGRDGTRYFAEYRGTVHAAPGSHVEAWFSGRTTGGRTVRSTPFTYRTLDQQGADVLLLANEDIGGANPAYPPGVTGPKYAGEYVHALRAAGRRVAVWDFDTDGVPDPLAVLGRFKAVVWYRGDSRLTMDPADVITRIDGQEYRDAQVANREARLVYGLRDYLNEGGGLLYAGETSNYYGTLDADLGGILAGARSAPDRACAPSGDDPSIDCLLLSDDFSRYYLGVDGRTATRDPAGFTGLGMRGRFGGTGSNAVDEAGTFAVTSDRMPAADHPLFRSGAVGRYAPDGGTSAVATADTVTLGFGLEQLTTQAARDTLMARIMEEILAPAKSKEPGSAG
jgi:hypothetical protein